jgi:glycosyltransferase involved in cell wall biosynthesis
MRILVAHNRYGARVPSGENRIVDLEVEALRARGTDVELFQRDSDEIPRLPIAQKAALPISPIYARHSQRELAKLLRARRPSLLHLHNPYPLLSPWVVRTAHDHGVPVVHTVHNFRQVCAAGIYFRDGRICMDCRGRAFGAPAVVHSCYRGSAAQSAVMATALAVHRKTWRGVERFIALNPLTAEHLAEFGIAEDRITLKPNAVPDPGDHEIAGTGFLFAGRLCVEKGVPLLLDAWRRHDDGSLGDLRIAGDGPLRGLVEAAAAERRDVTYLGHLDPAGLRAAMRAAAAVVVPSIWHDTAPVVISEALANARPVLGTNLGGIPFLMGADAAQPSACAGWVVDPTEGAIADALPLARAEAAARGALARRRYVTALHPDILIDSLLGIYEETIAAGLASATASRRQSSR